MLTHKLTNYKNYFKLDIIYVCLEFDNLVTQVTKIPTLFLNIESHLKLQFIIISVLQYFNKLVIKIL
jgi:hypothetical protein